MPKISKNEILSFINDLTIFKNLLTQLGPYVNHQYYNHLTTREEYKTKLIKKEQLELDFFKHIINIHKRNIWYEIIFCAHQDNTRYLLEVLTQYFFTLECILLAIDLPQKNDLIQVLNIRFIENQYNPQILLLKLVITNLQNNNDTFNLNELLNNIKNTHNELKPGVNKEINIVDYYLCKYKNVKNNNKNNNNVSNDIYTLILDELDITYQNFTKSTGAKELLLAKTIIFYEDTLNQISKKSNDSYLKNKIDTHVNKIREKHIKVEINNNHHYKNILLFSLNINHNSTQNSNYVHSEIFDALAKLHLLSSNSEQYYYKITNFITIEIKKLLLKNIKQICVNKDNNLELIEEKEKMIKLIENDLYKHNFKKLGLHNSDNGINWNDNQNVISATINTLHNTPPEFYKNKEEKLIMAKIDSTSQTYYVDYKKKEIIPMYSIINNNDLHHEAYETNKKYNCQELCCRIF